MFVVPGETIRHCVAGDGAQSLRQQNGTKSVGHARQRSSGVRRRGMARATLQRSPVVGGASPSVNEEGSQ